MKFDILQIVAMFALFGGIIISVYSKNLQGIIGWSLALMWFFVAQFALGRKAE